MKKNLGVYVVREAEGRPLPSGQPGEPRSFRVPRPEIRAIKEGETTFLPAERAVPPPARPRPPSYSRHEVQYPEEVPPGVWNLDKLIEALKAAFPFQPKDARPIDLPVQVVVAAGATATIILYNVRENARGMLTHIGFDSPGGGLAFALWDLQIGGSSPDPMFSRLAIGFGTLTDMIAVNYEFGPRTSLAIRVTNTNAIAPITAQARLKGWYTFI